MFTELLKKHIVFLLLGASLIGYFVAAIFGLVKTEYAIYITICVLVGGLMGYLTSKFSKSKNEENED